MYSFKRKKEELLMNSPLTWFESAVFITKMIKIHISLKLCQPLFKWEQARLFLTERVGEPVSPSHNILLLNYSMNKTITNKSRDHQLGP